MCRSILGYVLGLCHQRQKLLFKPHTDSLRRLDTQLQQVRRRRIHRCTELGIGIVHGEKRKLQSLAGYAGFASEEPAPRMVSPHGVGG